MTLTGEQEALAAPVEPEPLGVAVERASDLASDARAQPVRGAAGLAALPPWLQQSRDKLPQFIKYIWKVYKLPTTLGSLKDGRLRPQIPTAQVLRALLFTALFRFPSLNALEDELRHAPFQKLIGRRPSPGHKTFSADTVARVLDSLAHDPQRQLLRAVTARAERNKVFREGSYGAQRAVALDGWEPFCSFKRHCTHCLVRSVRKADQKVPQYYHRFVVAWLLGPRVEIVLDLEPLRTVDLRRQDGETTDCHDGEQTAALRLVDRLHAQFGRFIDLFVLDALYPSGIVMTGLSEHGYGAVITMKKPTDEPLKEALVLMEGQRPSKIWEDTDKSEHLEAWDVDELETLDTYSGKVRVLRVEVTSTKTYQRTTWCAAVIGKRTRRLSARTIHTLHRARWHIENTAFNQWRQHWHLSHVYRHSPGAVVSVLLLWCLAFNLLQLFVYRRLRRPRLPREVGQTIRALVTEMFQNLHSLRRSVAWPGVWDTS